MQQYRLNFRLLIGLAVGMVLSAGIVYSIWHFRIKHLSVVLAEQADKSLAAEDYKGTVQNLQQYLAIQPKDNEQRVKYAKAYGLLAEQIDTSLDDRSRAVGVMEQTLRDIPDQPELRKQLAKFYGSVGVYKDAINHLNFILDDPEAKVLKSNYLFQSQNFDEALKLAYSLIGFNPDKEEFDASQATLTDKPIIYYNTAVTLHDNKDRADLAERIINQAVQANPKSAEAYLLRGRYFIGIKEVDRGRSDITKALELGPEDADVLLAAVDLAADDKAYDKARELAEKGKKLDRKDWRYYQVIAKLLNAQKDYPGALQQLADGLKASPGGGRNLLFTQAQLQAESQDFTGLRATIDRMKDMGFATEYRDWYEAKALMGESNWIRAVTLLSRLRPWAESRGAGLSAELYFNLALSYEKLGQFDLADRAYDAVLERAPNSDPARFGKQRVSNRLAKSGTKSDDDPLKIMIDETKAKPKKDQDWEKVKQEIDRIVEERGLDDTARKILWGQVLLSREMYTEARALAGELNRSVPKDLRVQSFMLNTLRADPNQGPEAALKLMGQLPLEDSAYWRLFKAELMLAKRDDDTGPQLAGLLTGVDDWDVQQKVQLWSGLADYFIALSMVDEAKRCLTQVADAQPGDLQARMKLFNVALDLNDDAGMQAAQDEVLKVVGSKNDSSWLSTEARRQLSLIRRGRELRDKLDDVRQLVGRALTGRPDWSDLHLINAEIELLANNRKLALEELDRAKATGRLMPTAVAMHIRLLAQDGQLARAAQMLDDLPESSRFTLLGDLYWELLFRTDKADQAIQSAHAQAEANPKNALLQFRYGQLLARAADQPGVSDDKKKVGLEQAVQAVEQAVKMQPDLTDAWYSLIVFNAIARKQDAALKALRDAQLSLPGDDLQRILAKSYEALNGWFDAESIYRSIYEADPSDIARVKQLAAFYVGPSYKGPNMQDKVTPLVNQILRAGAEGKIPPDDDNLLWARRIAPGCWRPLAITSICAGRKTCWPPTLKTAACRSKTGRKWRRFSPRGRNLSRSLRRSACSKRLNDRSN